MSWLAQKLSVLPNTFLLAWGWQRRFLCLLCGVLSAFALPPFNFTPLLLFTFPGLVWLLDGTLEPGKGQARSKAWTGFALGWLFGACAAFACASLGEFAQAQHVEIRPYQTGDATILRSGASSAAASSGIWACLAGGSSSGACCHSQFHDGISPSNPCCASKSSGKRP